MNTPNRKGEQGFGMVEVLVTLLIVMIGLLGLAGLHGTALTAQMEAYQRAQAIVIAKDMAARINANRTDAATYATAEPLGAENENPLGPIPVNCATLTGKNLDFCEWHNALLGAAETSTAGSVGAMIKARGCIDYVAGPPERVLVTVAWQGLVPTAAPSVTCGQDVDGDGVDDYGDDELRRVITIPITIADLAS